MREITYREILENIDCGLVIFFEDDFVQPDTVDIDEVLYKAIIMDENLQSQMMILLNELDVPFSSAMQNFLDVCKPAVESIDDWSVIADVKDILSQYKTTHPELSEKVDTAYLAITSVSCDQCASVLFQFGLHSEVPLKYKDIFLEYIEAGSRWQPFVVFNNYNSDIATQVETLIKNMPDLNNTVTCIIDNSIRGEDRANDIIDELERICKDVTKRIIGAVVTSNKPVERIGEFLFVEYVNKSEIKKLKQSLLHSAYHYLLCILKEQLSSQVIDAFKKASAHRNIAIYLATMARCEGISNYEILIQWISAICEVGLSNSCDIPKLVAIANMLDACEESPDFESMEDMSDINTHEAFDYEINRFYQPVAPGDIFQTADGDIYILVGQACDMMMTNKRKRRNGLCELVKAEITPLIWKEKTQENLTHIWINNFKSSGTVSALKIDYTHRYFLDNEIASLCSFNIDGECRINLDEKIPENSLRMLQPYQINYYSDLQKFFTAMRGICSSEARPFYDIISADEHTSRVVKPSQYTEGDNTLLYGLKRIARVKDHYYLYIYKLYLEYRGRLPFETINLARMQTRNVLFSNGATSVNLDIDVFLARDKNSAKSLPWIIDKDQMDIVVNTFSSGSCVKEPQEHYWLNNDSIQVPLSNGRKLVLTKTSNDRVHVQVNR